MQYQTRKIMLTEFVTQRGHVFNDVEATYTMYGSFDGKKPRALFFHGFSTSSEIHTWWTKFNFEDLVASFDIISVNSIGSCYGSIGPISKDPATGKPFFTSFPSIKLQDTTNFTVDVLKEIGLEGFDFCLGASLGGMQALDMYLRFPHMAKKFISVCGAPLPFLTRLNGVAQANLLEYGIEKQVDKDFLQYFVGLSRFFFRLSCTTEAGLEALSKKHRIDEFEHPVMALEDYFVSDAIKYRSGFNAYSYCTYLRMLADFEIDIEKIKDLEINPSRLILVDITNDRFVTKDCIATIYEKIKIRNPNVVNKSFKSLLGHEAFILEGDRFYDFIKTDCFS